MTGFVADGRIPRVAHRRIQSSSMNTSDLPVVIKIGGSTLGQHDTTLDDLVAYQRGGGRAVVVHGGGNHITDWLKRLDLPSHFVRGLRVTDPAALDVVVAVLAGL